MERGKEGARREGRKEYGESEGRNMERGKEGARREGRKEHVEREGRSL